jgi:hypothetical protein
MKMRIKHCPAGGEGSCLNEFLIEDLIEALRVTQDAARMTACAADIRFNMNPTETFNRYFPEIRRLLENLDD